jgi:beta-N-acetylhexosaminidase
MCGIEGETLTPEDIRRLTHPLIGGVILFSRNIQSPSQVRELCDAIHALRSPALIIGIDQEGGRVQRMRGKAFVTFPPMGELQHYIEGSPEACGVYASNIGKQLAKELRRVRVDFSFTPVLDIDYGVSRVIGNRAFGGTPELVTELAGSFASGMGAVGCPTVGKHFPGHGYVAADSHTAMPVDDRSWKEMQPDLEPYRHLVPSLQAVMMAHVIYPEMDKNPAGYSQFWVEQVLRGELGFNGLVFSDDLGMAGATAVGDWVARADAAFHAGCDVMLACNEFDAIDQLLTEWKPELDGERARQLAERWSAMEPKWWRRKDEPAPPEIRIKRRIGARVGTKIKR